MIEPACGLVEPEEFRGLIGKFATGVTVVTTCDDGVPYGTTASAVTSVSLEPPTLLICMNRSSDTGQAITRSGHFAVNVLSEAQALLAQTFAKKGSDFGPHPFDAGRRGAPLLVGTVASFECHVTTTVDAGTHTIIVGEVESASGRDGMPLAYFCGKFGRVFVDD
jgi:4-nitrophenol 2-monooxygenase / 4-nitrocatechol 4-monooxygenase, reductase component